MKKKNNDPQFYATYCCNIFGVSLELTVAGLWWS